MASSEAKSMKFGRQVNVSWHNQLCNMVGHRLCCTTPCRQLDSFVLNGAANSLTSSLSEGRLMVNDKQTQHSCGAYAASLPSSALRASALRVRSCCLAACRFLSSSLHAAHTSSLCHGQDKQGCSRGAMSVPDMGLR